MHGRGNFWYLNGDRFEGNWVKGKKNGFGVLYAANGEVFECVFENDQQLRTEKRSSESGNGDCRLENEKRSDAVFDLKVLGDGIEALKIAQDEVVNELDTCD